MKHIIQTEWTLQPHFGKALAKHGARRGGWAAV